MVSFLIGCALLLLAVRYSGTRSEAPKEKGTSPEATASEEARCEGTRSFHPKGYQDSYVTNDLPGCPKGGPLSGTDKPDKLYGGEGDDGIRGLGDKDYLFGGDGNDVFYAGAGDDTLGARGGEDVIHGGPGRDAYAYSTNYWGQDTIKDTSIPDTATYNGDFLFFTQDIIGYLTIDLHSDTASHEVYLSGTQSTIDWAGDVIEDVSNYGYGIDHVRGNDAANYLRSWNGGDTVDGKGGDDIIDVADAKGDDTVVCGGGTDDVYYDGGDNVADSSCEHLHLVNPT